MLESKAENTRSSLLPPEDRLKELKVLVGGFISDAVVEGRSKKTGNRMKGFLNMWLSFVKDTQ